MDNTVSEWFRHLNETTGINYSVFYDPYDWAQYLHGFLTTTELALLSLVLSVLLGLVGVWLQRARFAPVRWVVNAYVELFRNTPPLAQIYFFYFGIGTLMPRYVNPEGLMQPALNGFQWAVISLTLFAGAFNVEIFRSGMEAVPESLKDAASSLGYSRLGVFYHVVLPLSMRICLPALTNNLVNLVKTTEIAYAIAVPGLLYVSNNLWSNNLNVPEMMNVLLFSYLSLVAILVVFMTLLERWQRIPGYSFE